jgi:hypothetical protein
MRIFWIGKLDTQNFCHLLLELGVAAFQIVATLSGLISSWRRMKKMSLERVEHSVGIAGRSAALRTENAPFLPLSGGTGEINRREVKTRQEGAAWLFDQFITRD